MFMKAENSRCLVLNSDYSPLTIVGWHKAIMWSLKNSKSFGIEIIDFYKHDFIVGTNNKKFPIPCIAKTKRYLKINRQSVTFSRKNLFVRDDYTCQYCGKQFILQELTYDHVIPKSKWRNDSLSPTCWTNIVTACIKCNRNKGSRTPKQANMDLLSIPIKPTKNLKYLPVTNQLLSIRDTMPEEWKNYLPDSYYA
jgi:hypothetical protein